MKSHHPLLSVLLAALALPVPAQEKGVFDPRPTMTAVAELLQEGHVSQQPLDKTISERAFDQLLRGLDPLGLYFKQSDVAEWAKDREQLARYLIKGDDTFAKKVQQRYQQLVVAGVDRGLHCLSQPFDFSTDETLDFEVAPKDFATTDAQLDDRWRR